MFKDAPASEIHLGRRTFRRRRFASLDWRSAPVTVALRVPEREAPPAAERPAKPGRPTPNAARRLPTSRTSPAPSAGAGCAGIRSWPRSA